MKPNPYRSPRKPKRARRQEPLDTSDRAPAENPRRWLVPAARGLLVLACVAAYANSFQGVFLFDDMPCIVVNPPLASLGGTLSATKADIPNGLWRRPVVRFSLALNRVLGGLDPWGYHLVNLLIHLAAGLLLFDLIRRTLLLERMPRWLRRDALPIALAATLLWLLHPLQTESVTYIVQRLEAMMGLFYLACLYCVLRGSQSRTAWPWYVAAVAACWLGMGSKEVMFTAPLTTALYDRIFLSRSWRELLKARWWVYLGFLPAIAWMVYQAGATSDMFSTRRTIDRWNHYTRWEYLRSQPLAILHYFRLVVWPVGQCLDYGWPAADSAMQIVLPGLVVVGLLVASLAALWRAPAVGFLGISFFLVLSVTSSLKPLGMLVVEHRMYLPLAAVTTAAVVLSFALVEKFGSGAASATDRRRKLLLGVWGVAALALGATTYARNEVYADELGMWMDVVRVSPESPRGNHVLAICLLERGEYARAARHDRRTLELAPNHAESHQNLGLALSQLGQYAEAEEHYRQAAEWKPDDATIHADLALLLAERGKRPEAIAAYRRALELSPNDADLHNNLATLLAAGGDLAAARTHFEEALRIDPSAAGVHLNLARLYQQSQPVKAIEHCRAAVRLMPDSPEAHYQLANTLVLQGRIAEAKNHLREALRLRPRWPQARQNLQVLERLPQARGDAAGGSS